MPDWIETYIHEEVTVLSQSSEPPQMRSVVSQISLRACSKRTNSSLAGESEGEGVPVLVMTLPSSGFEEWERGPQPKRSPVGSSDKRCCVVLHICCDCSVVNRSFGDDCCHCRLLSHLYTSTVFTLVDLFRHLP